MKNIKKYIMSAAVFSAVGFGLNSCDIDMLPLNEVVLENYWTNKDDVESVVNACYSALMDRTNNPDSRSVVDNMLVWGEDRSDNVVEGSSAPADLKYILKGSVKTTNKWCKWDLEYKAINYCNTVLQYAPEVAEKDPNYTDSDLRINIAECKFIRALCYFNLIKTFKNVPFTFEASIDDTQDYRLPQTKFEIILDSLIADIESCKDYAPRRYSEYYKNTGRVTRAAMYSLLAELYLWRASDANLSKSQQDEYYKKCIERCDHVLSFKLQQYKDNSFLDASGEMDLRPLVDKEVYGEYGYPLLAEETTIGQNTTGPAATNAIFGKGGAYETIFEIKFNAGSYKRSNTAIMDQFGSRSSNYIVANEKMMETKPENGNSYSDQKLFSVPSDYRSIATYYYQADASDWNILKYVVDNNRAGVQTSNYGAVGTTFKPAQTSQSVRSDNCPNWIIYRMTEIMLFRAEAEIELAANMISEEAPVDTAAVAGVKKMHKISVYTDGATLSNQDELLSDAFNLISAVYRRSNPTVKTQSKYAPTMPKDIGAFRTLLMNERRREFLFEGKRYYDLVRASRRAGNTQLFRSALSTKYGDAGASVAIKMIQMDFMYLPVARGEMKVNPSLVQNQCYLDEEENIKN